MLSIRYLFALVITLASPTFLYAAPGDFDTSFGGGKGWVSTGFERTPQSAQGQDTLQQADGKLVVVGSAYNGNNDDFALARYNADGTLDTSFNNTGKVTTAVGADHDYAQSVIQQVDGKLVVVGFAWNTTSDFVLVRYNADGSLDPDFGVDGKVVTEVSTSQDQAYSVIQQTDGKLVVAGNSSGIVSGYDFALVRYNLDGSLDASFGTGGKVTTAFEISIDYNQSIIQQADGKLVVAGSVYNGNDYDFALVRYNADGSLDTTFNGTGKVTTAVVGATNDYVNSLIQQADGKLVAAGYSYTSGYDFALVRYNTDGSLDTTFNDTGLLVKPLFGESYDYAQSVIQQADGKLVAAGYSSYYGGLNNFALVRYNANGTLDTTFNGNGKVITSVGTEDNLVYSVIQQADGKLVAAGCGSNIGSNDSFALARYNVGGSLDASFNGTGTVTTAFEISSDYNRSIVQQADGKLVAAGYSNDGYNDFALARYNADGSLDTTFNGSGKVITVLGTSYDEIYSVIQQADGKLVAVGYSSYVGGYNFALVRYNPDGSLDTGFNGTGIATTTVGLTGGKAYSVIQQADGKLVAAGYSWGSSDEVFALVRYNVDGSLDTSFNGTGKVVTAIGLDHDRAYSVIQQADGKLVAAGYSNNFGGGDLVLVRYNTDGSLDASFGTGGKVATEMAESSSKAYSVIQQADGKLVATGYSNSSGYNHVALVRYNADGSLDATFNSTDKLTMDVGYYSNNVANSIIQQADGKLAVAVSSYAGSFYGARGNAEFVVARFESGQSDTDGDGVLDWLDTDNDNDAVPNASDAFPLDASESVDTDGDGVGDNADNCAVANANQLDWDSDGLGDACDDPVPMPDDLAGVLGKDKAGSAVAFAGDFNGDGYGDYVVGIPGFDVATKLKGAGRAEVISGKDGTVLASLNGVAAKDALSTAVAGGGDIDGDGFDDVVVGAPNAGVTHAGTVTVIYGRADSDNRTPVTTNGTLKKSLFGAALALGDVDGDSRADILVGAPKDNDTSRSPIVKAAGSVTVYTVAEQDHPETLTALGTPFYGAVPKAYAGTAVAAGDLDGTGVAILIGAPNDTVGTVKSSGSVKAYLLNAATPIFSKSGTKGSQFGKAIAVGDIDHLNYADVLVGSPMDDADSKHKDTGSISVFSGIDGSELTPKKYGANPKASLGYSVAVGDVNDNGNADLIAGARKDDKPTDNPKKPVKDTGSVSIWSGSDYMPVNTLYGAVTKDYFGSAVSAGDINSDGKADVIIGIPGFDVSTKIKDAGKVTVLSGAAL